MYSDKKKQVAKYSIESNFSANGKIASLLNFLEKHLTEFSGNRYLKTNTHEEILNQKLFRYLSCQNTAFVFIPENRDETGVNKSKPDFGVYEKYEVYDDNQKRFFDIECKRLYDITKSKQYVLGETGGIQRFKENKHGKGLPYSAMIGYVEIEDFYFWHNKVNSWISDKNEHLEEIAIKEIAKYKSTHKRIDTQKRPIELLHFWLNIN